MRLSQNMGSDLNPLARRGRPKGPAKKRLTVYVLPETAEELNKRAFSLSSLGEAIDKLLKRFVDRKKPPA
jgi:hypothetical protein